VGCMCDAPPPCPRNMPTVRARAGTAPGSSPADHRRPSPRCEVMSVIVRHHAADGGAPGPNPLCADLVVAEHQVRQDLDQLGADLVGHLDVHPDVCELDRPRAMRERRESEGDISSESEARRKQTCFGKSSPHGSTSLLMSIHSEICIMKQS
jgi:hypothetical protein